MVRCIAAPYGQPGGSVAGNAQVSGPFRRATPNSFLAGQEAEARKIRKLPSRRETKSLATWALAKASPDIPALAGNDPDPPLIA